ncbi:MAG: polyprenyl synthetase family protein [Bacilli bacterium]|nr:polyprenyl synthetase family protein [Bacilli bacterium]
MDYTITNDDFKSSRDFYNWFLEKKPFDKEFDFKCSDNIKNLYLFLTYFISSKDDIQKEVQKYNDSLKNEDNRFIKEAIDEFVISNDGGKYLRGVLSGLGYSAFGGRDNYYMPLAVALEIFQTSILIHDDIIDKSDKRRGIDTIPLRYKKKYHSIGDISDSMALCLGDLGFYLANNILVNNYSDFSNLPLLLNYYNEMAIKTCKGEILDVFLPFYEKNTPGLDNLEDTISLIYELKTAWYSVVSPFALGCILGGASLEDLRSIEDALLNLGTAYQIKDDLLGIYGNEKVIGKGSSDISEFKQTILYSYTIRTAYKDDLLKYYGKDNAVSEVREIFDKCGAREYANKIMEKLFDESSKKISFLKIDDKYKNILLGFCEFLKVRGK